MTTRASVREHIRAEARGDINRAIDIALDSLVSGGFIRVPALVYEDVRKFSPDPEPLDVDRQDSPNA